jgi:hypothetical protein
MLLWSALTVILKRGIYKNDNFNKSYIEPSIISGTGAAILSKLTLGILATTTLEVVPFCTYAPFPVLLPFLNTFWKSVFRECVHHHLQFCLDHLSAVKIVALLFHVQSGKLRKVG